MQHLSREEPPLVTTPDMLHEQMRQGLFSASQGMSVTVWTVCPEFDSDALRSWIGSASKHNLPAQTLYVVVPETVQEDTQPELGLAQRMLLSMQALGLLKEAKQIRPQALKNLETAARQQQLAQVIANVHATKKITTVFVLLPENSAAASRTIGKMLHNTYIAAQQIEHNCIGMFFLTRPYREVEDLPPALIPLSQQYFTYVTMQTMLPKTQQARYFSQQNLPAEIRQALLSSLGGWYHLYDPAIITARQLPKTGISTSRLRHAWKDQMAIRKRIEMVCKSLPEVERASFFASIASKTRLPKNHMATLMGLVPVPTTVSSIIVEQQQRHAALQPQSSFSPTQLSELEQSLFALFYKHRNSVVHRDAIGQALWQGQAAYSDWALDKLISRLRAKLLMYRAPYSLLTARGRGFELQAK